MTDIDSYQVRDPSYFSPQNTKLQTDVTVTATSCCSGSGGSGVCPVSEPEPVGAAGSVRGQGQYC